MIQKIHKKQKGIIQRADAGIDCYIIYRGLSIAIVFCVEKQKTIRRGYP